jgi:exodeoxyribonuclease V gamma subunit
MLQKYLLRRSCFIYRFSGKTMDTQHQHTGHRLFPGFSIIHAYHLEDLRQVAVGWIKAHPLQVLESEQFIVQSNGMAQ